MKDSTGILHLLFTGRRRSLAGASSNRTADTITFLSVMAASLNTFFLRL